VTRFSEVKREGIWVEAETRVLLTWLRNGWASCWVSDRGEEISMHARLL